MPICLASRKDLEIWLEVNVVPRGFATESMLRLVMSLKRHSYHYLEKGEGKEQNSVLFGSIDVPTICTDAKDIGQQLQASIANNMYAILGEPTDFTTCSGRVYRCDNHRGQDGFNHFYPIKGQGVLNCDYNLFEWIQALRRIESDWSSAGSEIKKFTSYRPLQRNDEDWKLLRQQLVNVSNSDKTIAKLEKQGRPQPKKDPFSNQPRSGLFKFSSPSSDSDSDSDSGSGGKFW
ncbi:MAG: hypothetical protein LUQ11_13830 [Methylococcaceae bacterium]|nr:hypothetical protein [Methylococcaceae bacterium]